VAGREGKRGECQTWLGLVWRETGAVRNARPSRGQAASTRKRTQWKEDAQLHCRGEEKSNFQLEKSVVVNNGPYRRI